MHKCVYDSDKHCASSLSSKVLNKPAAPYLNKRQNDKFVRNNFNGINKIQNFGSKNFGIEFRVPNLSPKVWDI